MGDEPHEPGRFERYWRPGMDSPHSREALGEPMVPVETIRALLAEDGLVPLVQRLKQACSEAECPVEPLVNFVGSRAVYVIGNYVDNVGKTRSLGEIDFDVPTNLTGIEQVRMARALAMETLWEPKLDDAGCRNEFVVVDSKDFPKGGGGREEVQRWFEASNLAFHPASEEMGSEVDGDEEDAGFAPS